MYSSASQTGCLASISTPLGTDVLLLDGFAGREAISELFRFQLRMRSFDMALDASVLVGRKVTVTLQQPTGPQRWFNGIVTRFVNAGADLKYGYYTAEMAPSLMLLTLGRNRAIYQNLSALAIIEQILGAFSIAYELRLSGAAFPVREYCVQFDESPFSFISRLMEEEGMFYFFTFADGVHTMVLADAPSAHQTGAAESATLHVSTGAMSNAAVQAVSRLELVQGLGASAQVFADYDYLTAQTSSAAANSAAAASAGEQYVYPGKYADAADATRKAAIRAAAQSVDQQTGTGSSVCYSLAAGTTFTLAGHSSAALNVMYVVRSVTHSASNGAYSNEFEVFPQTVPFRAPFVTPRPVVAGTHTATVVGSSGEEIWTDAYGRVKVKFHWDRSATADQNSSCWVRVVQSSAGQGWGHLFLPRVGHEVVVSYVDGDPDRPLVTGSVYNLQSTLPVALPGLQTQSVMRSRTSKEGTAGNEMRMEDKSGSEELYFHAQKDMTVEIENALTTTVKAGAETHVLQKGDRTVDVQAGNETHNVKGTRALDVTGDETHTNHAAFTHSVTGNYQLKVSGDLVIDVSGSITIKSGAALLNQAGTSLDNKAGTTLTNKAGATLTNDAPEVQQKASAAHTVQSGGILELKGSLIKLN
ncbi:type VI secretion system Vgr family protein [Paraburkholderia saeva]|uniref:type VI secretion system Vgr family protein n=1 Tax=Paraburkholderia saeva TaxID=2777537 RepID=UPI001DFBA5A2|nr:type VI secretion system tip protein TssI/VgrG [Paraburkholderia saeva]CAG4890052.1 Actin cross-linking toxin VgrG1 [Paraburkholderia saeva]CAG4897732.1 Actin cross-linking toxin VgrG1 [Paraburkholderia saeva]